MKADNDISSRNGKSSLELGIDKEEGGSMNYQTIILEKEEGIATITFNRPQRRNALRMHKEPLGR